MNNKTHILSTLLALATPVLAGPSLYSLTEIGDLPGGEDWSEAWDVNELGQVVGDSPMTTGVHGFLWDDGIMTDLGDLPTGADASNARAINDSAQIAGFSNVETTANDQFQFSRRRPFLWEGGVMTNLGRLPEGQYNAEGWGITRTGEVGGWSHAGPGAQEAVRIKALPSISMDPMGTHLPTRQSRAYAINNMGQLAGFSDGNATPKPVMWNTDNSISALGDLPGGGEYGEGRGINDHGHVVGWSQASTGQRAFLWREGAMIDLGDLPGGNDLSWAWAVNNQGLVVGFSEAEGGDHAFRWTEESGMEDLNDLLDSSGDGWTLLEAKGLNDKGQIVGVGLNPSGVRRGFLLTPVGPIVEVPGYSIELVASGATALAGLTVGSDGFVYAADFSGGGNGRALRVPTSASDSTFEVLAAGLANPTDIAVSPDGRVFVTELMWAPATGPLRM